MVYVHSVKKWHMIVNLIKTKLMVFNNRKLKDIKFIYHRKELVDVSEYKYVDTIARNSQNIFKTNKSHLALKAQIALFALCDHIQNSVGYLLPETAMKMFDVQIRPILEYAHEIWYNGKTINPDENIHLSYTDEKLIVKRLSCTNAIYARFGRSPLITNKRFKF